MDIDLLRCFLMVAHYENFTLAAKKLYIAQPALSKRIARLETHLGVKLFHRTKREVQLTDAGKVLAMEAPKLLHCFEDTEAKVRNAGNTDEEHISIAFLGAIASEFLPMFNQFRNNYPKINWELFTYNTAEIKQSLEENSLDLAITIDSELHTIPNLVFEPLYQEHLLLLLPKRHPFALLKKHDFSQLEHEDFVTFSPDTSQRGYEQLTELCAGWGFSPRIVRECPSIENIVFMVAAGIGIAILPSHARRYISETLIAIPVPESSCLIQIAAIYPQNRTRSSLLLFIEKLKIFTQELTLI